MIATATSGKEAGSMNSEIVPTLAHVIGQTRAVAVLRHGYRLVLLRPHKDYGGTRLPASLDLRTSRDW